MDVVFDQQCGVEGQLSVWRSSFFCGWWTICMNNEDVKFELTAIKRCLNKNNTAECEFIALQ